MNQLYPSTRFRFFFVLCIILCLSRELVAQDYESTLDHLFSKWNNSTPAVAVAIKFDTGFVYKKTFGLADLEHNVPAMTETIFESGSVAKQFTAMSILLLESEGKLLRSDDVRKFVPEIPKYEVPITLQMLLNHTSGLKDWGSIGALTGWPRTTRVYTQELALQIMSKQKSTNFTPGTEYSYSNSNYSLLVTIVERVSGMTLPKFTDTRLFKPLGMTHTQWRDNFREVIPNRAIGYQKTNGEYEQLMPFENVHGHGGLLTTLDDLLKWNALLATHSIGGDHVYKNRIQQGKLTNGNMITYASGLQIGRHNEYLEIAHSGATAGYRAWLAYYPEKKLSVVLLSSDAGFAPASVGHEVAGILLGEPQVSKTQPRPQINIDKNDLQKFEGYFRSTRHFNVERLTLSKDGISQGEIGFHPVHKDTLQNSSGAKWIFIKPGYVMSSINADTLTYRKVAPPLNDKTIAGTYACPEADAIYQVRFEGDDLWVDIKPFPPFKLVPSFKNGYFSEEGDLFEFIKDKKSKYRLEVSTSRAEKMIFTSQ